MAVDDHGIEAIRKAAEEVTTGDKSDYYLKSLSGGKTDVGNFVELSATGEGHLEVAIHAPRLPFGSIHTESLTPIFQNDAVYGINDGGFGQSIKTISGSGAVTSVDSTYNLQTGTTIYSQAVLQSRKRIRYRPGQGIVARFTASFTAGVASSYQVAGPGHAEDGIYFGYKDTNFGILYSHHGVREIQTLTITTASSTAENVVVTLNGVAFNIAVTASGNINRTAYELSLGTYAGWSAQVVGQTVVFLASAVGNKAGAFSVAGATIGGSFTETKAGAAATEDFVAQTSWNGDPLDGTGASGFTIDPAKLNVYQIKIQYLGAGAISCEVETTSDGNNAIFTTVHTLKLPNTLTKTTFSNPSFPITYAAYSAGSTTNLTVKGGSFAGFIEGWKITQGNRFSYLNQITTATAGALHTLFSIKNSSVFNTKANQSVVNLLSITGALKHNNPCTIYIIRNAALVGNPAFSQYSTSSCTYYSTAETTCTYSNNAQLIWTGTLGDTSSFNHSFEDDITLQPGEMITVAAKTIFGSASYVVAGVNTREDQ